MTLLGHIARALFARDALLLHSVALLLSRVVIMGEMAPFGLAFFAAVAQSCRGKSGSVAVWSMIGILSTGQYLDAAVYAWAIFLIYRFTNTPPARFRRFVTVPPVMFVAVLSGGLATLFLQDTTLYRIMLVILEAAICTISSYIFIYGVPFLTEGRNREEMPAETRICAIVVFSAAVAGLGGLNLGEYSLRNMVGTFLVLWLAFAEGPGIGAAAGVACGLAIGLTEAAVPAAVTLYALAGTLAGVVRGLGRYAAILGCLLGIAIAGLSFAQHKDGLLLLTEAAIAAGAFFLFGVRSKKRMAEKERKEPVEEENKTIGKLESISGIFSDLAETFGQISAGAREKAKEEDLSRLLSAVGDRVCGTCSRKPICWENDFYRTYQAMLDMLSLAETPERLYPQLLPQPLKDVCLKQADLIETACLVSERNSSNLYWRKKIAESRQMVTEQIKATASILTTLAEEVRREEKGVRMDMKTAPVREERYILESGLAFAAKIEGSKSGDTCSVVRLENGKMLMMLSDGMGSGNQAAHESNLAVTFLERLMKAGFAVDTAVKTVNSMLLLRMPAETFTTVDMAVIDSFSGEAEFLKIAAAPSFVKRVREVSVIKSSALPIGILQQVEMEPVKMSLAPGDLIIMVSDGISDIGRRGMDRENWIANFLRRQSTTRPQELADRLLRQALDMTDGQARDDMTVLVVALMEKTAGRTF